MNTHPLVQLAMQLVTRPAPAEPALSDAGREQLRAALARYRGTPNMLEAALALLGFASFLTAELDGHEAAEAIGELVAHEARDELLALGAETRASGERRAEAALKFFGAHRGSKKPPTGR